MPDLKTIAQGTSSKKKKLRAHVRESSETTSEDVFFISLGRKGYSLSMKRKHINKFGPSFFGYIAHRGYHTDEATENGLKAFQNAIDRNIPFEFDIHITKDKKLVVCHDSELERTTGKKGIIEDLTFDEIRKGYRLHDGGVVPSLEEVLALNGERELMVIELKVYRKNYKELAKAVLPYLRKIKDKKKVVLISFDPRVLWRVKKSKIATSLLLTVEYFWVWHFRFLFDSIDIDKRIVSLPCVCRHRKRHVVNVWTLESKKDFDSVKCYADAFTCQLFEPSEIK